MQRGLVSEYARRRRLVATSRAVFCKVPPLADILPILVCDAQFSPALDAAEVEALVAVDFAQTGAAQVCATALGAVCEMQGLGASSGASVRFGVGGAVEFFEVHVVLGFALGEADDERGHGHFNVELDHVDNGVELDVDNLVVEEHEADEEGIHADGDDHELAVEAYKRRILGQTMLIHQADLDGSEEVPV